MAEPASAGWRLRTYSRFARLMTRTLEPRVSSTAREEKSVRRGRCGAWFHAASVGEMEALWPVIRKWGSRCGDEPVSVSVFSPSAWKHLERFEKEWDFGAPLLTGYSPAEGRWSDMLGQAAPSVFVTAKYEAWPELWATLSRRGIPLAILGARERSSFKVVRRVLSLLGESCPKLYLACALEDESGPLKRLFPGAAVECTGDPRWDRVFERSGREVPRLSDLMKRYKDLPRPWGIVGSGWPEEAGLLRETLDDVPGTLWFAPHNVDAESVRGIERIFEGLCQSTLPGEPPGDKPPKVLIVNEAGLLSELYGHGDWAFVGGGLGRSIHSTIEPAIHGLPICAGDKGSDRFSETAVLERSGQLVYVKDAPSFRAFLDRLGEFSAKRDHWRGCAEARRGATSRFIEGMQAALQLA